MAIKTQTKLTYIFRYCCYILLLYTFSIIIPLLYSSYFPPTPPDSYTYNQNQPFDLLSFPSAWNQLAFSSKLPSRRLKIALFVKRWPEKNRAGGMERHALTLHLALAKRGHELHVFTASLSPSSSFFEYSGTNMYFHLSKPVNGFLDQDTAWEQFLQQNRTVKPFDVVHSESVGLFHTRAEKLPNLAVSWHGIGYEAIHGDIIQELLRSPHEGQSQALVNRISRVVDEVRFFPSYSHHVATSNHVGDILKRVYMIPDERVHIILNGVDEEIFKPDPVGALSFRRKFGIPNSNLLVLGLAGRLVKDKGHPLIFEALKQMFKENPSFKDNVMILVAGDGPWGQRYKDLGGNIRVLGALDRAQVASFYNSIDIFLHPTLRDMGLDQTVIEATLCSKPVLVTRVASITGSVIIGPEVGYTFSPTVKSLKRALYQVWEDGRYVLHKKGKAARERGMKLFTATKMAAAYERLFLCISDNNDCLYQSSTG
ncbi:uncharacterized protein LOC124915552 [Impatiens glandulifera]|uniref:uncharacterized protein LOC124915552 n=1 Tax=Impatiens glandulifera TaxID=253017 RepID=UPI001FB11A47|nr:uncharacterized protein LOC124915552 [Impatiens glandulifera]